MWATTLALYSHAKFKIRVLDSCFRKREKSLIYRSIFLLVTVANPSSEYSFLVIYPVII